MSDEFDGVIELEDQQKNYCINVILNNKDKSDFKELVEPLDLGGIVAVRGFVYQYYVAIYYILKMLTDDSCWWNEVRYEMYDDISLHNSNNTKVRLIQVKTVREDESHKHKKEYFSKRTTSKSTDSIKKFNSIIDKLFINSVSGKLEINDTQFELVTNTRLDSLVDIEIFHYLSNTEYNLKIKDSDFYYQLLKCGISDNEIKLVDYLEGDLKSYLSKFRINKLGGFNYLNTQINDLLKELISKRFDMVPTTIIPSISSELIHKLFIYIVSRTHDDATTSFKAHIFCKKEINDFIHENIPLIIDEIQREIEKRSHYSLVCSACKQITIESLKYRGTIGDEPISGKIIEITNQIQDYFTEKLDCDDYSSQYFLNKLFDLTAQKRHSNYSDDYHYLINALTQLIHVLLHYNSFNFVYEDKDIITVEGNLANIDRFLLFDARDKKEFNESILELLYTSESNLEVYADSNICLSVTDSMQSFRELDSLDIPQSIVKNAYFIDYIPYNTLNTMKSIAFGEHRIEDMAHYINQRKRIKVVEIIGD